MRILLLPAAVLFVAALLPAQELSIARISDHALEIRIGPTNKEPSPTPMLADFSREEKWRGPVETAPAQLVCGELRLEMARSPLVIRVLRKDCLLYTSPSPRDV
jgi:hypothetical protein